MPGRMMLIPAPPDPVTCRDCPMHCENEDGSDSWCAAFCNEQGGWAQPEEDTNGNDYLRLPACLAAEQAARTQADDLARMRRVEEAAREMIRRLVFGLALAIEAAPTLRAALEEK